jgi:hypothetical protein
VPWEGPPGQSETDEPKEVMSAACAEREQDHESEHDWSKKQVGRHSQGDR